MPNFNITGILTTPQILNAFELGFVGRTGTIVSAGPVVTVNNLAELIVEGAIASSGAAVAITDTGRLFVGASGSVISSGTIAVNIGGTDGAKQIVNAGTILAQSMAIGWFTISHDADVFSFRLNNSGTISSLVGHGVGGYARDSGIYEIINSGLVEGGNAGIKIEIGTPGTEARILNSGTVLGAFAGIVGDVYADLIVNSGRIASGDLIGMFAALDLSAGDDQVVNTGEIVGNVYLGTGNDTYLGRHGSVSGFVSGDEGHDYIQGGREGESLYGGAGDDVIYGMDGDDLITGDIGLDTLHGGGGDDTIEGGSNNDRIHGGSGHDYLDGGSGADVIFGDSGDDTIIGGTADDTLYGGSGDDVVNGGANQDLLFGGTGNDELDGGTGADSLYGGAGEDSLYGGTADDLLFGGSGDDLMLGGDGNDLLRGALGDDDLYGGNGNDTIYGGAGHDTLRAGDGIDVLFGGAGADVFAWTAVTESPQARVGGQDRVEDFTAGVDKIDLSEITPGLVFVATFTGVAGQVRYNGNLNGGTLGRLYVDTSGNGASNFSIDLDGAPMLTVDDLIL